MGLWKFYSVWEQALYLVVEFCLQQSIIAAKNPIVSKSKCHTALRLTKAYNNQQANMDFIT